VCNGFLQLVPYICTTNFNSVAATAAKERKSFFRKITGKSEQEETEMTFFDHIEVLRWHIIRSVVVWLVLVIAIFANIDFIYDNIILGPSRSEFITYAGLCNLGKKLHLGASLCMKPVRIEFLINQVSGTFTSALSIAFVGAIIAAFPYIFWELWRFIKPALSTKERKYASGSIFWVSLCFFAGVAFAYYILAPFTFNFLANFTLGKSGLIKYQPTVNDYIDTLTNLLLGCGIAFEMPVLAFVLAKLGILTGTTLKKYFKHALLIILIVAAIITPSPDLTSQFIVAIPLLLLYWISIVLASRVQKQRAKEEAEWS
jgi:sec-independent protein translocase protein TatC